jgi:hypothetical protein
VPAKHDHGMGHVPAAITAGDPGARIRQRLEPPLHAVFRADGRGGGHVTLARTRNPNVHGSFGYVGRFVRVSIPQGGRFPPGTLTVAVPAAARNVVAADTLRVFRWVEAEKGWELVVASGIGQTGDYVWAHITEPGRYTAIGISRDPFIARTLIVLAALEDVLAREPHSSGSQPSLAEGVCRLMLCDSKLRERLADPEFAAALIEGNRRLGLPDAPDSAPGLLPKPLSGDPCKVCGHVVVDVGRNFDTHSLRPPDVTNVRRPPELEVIDPWPNRVLGRWRVLPHAPTGADVVLAMHAALLYTGKVLYFGGSENVRTQHDASPPLINNTRLWDPKTGATEVVGSPAGHDLFCCGHALLADGRLLAAGGTEVFGGDHAVHGNHPGGSRRSSIFDPVASGGTWAATEPLNLERDLKTGGGAWYPTLVTLPDGRVLRLTGHPDLTDSRHNNTMLETFDPATKSWTDLGAAADLPAVQDKTTPGPYYPRVHVLPDGRLFFATPLRLLADGPPSMHESRVWNPATKQWKSVGSGPGDDEYISGGETSVLLPLLPENDYRPRVLLCNGAVPKIIDLGSKPALPKSKVGSPLASGPIGWEPTAPRELEGRPTRRFATAVLLPDASVLVIGGSRTGESIRTDAVLTAERFEPPDESKGTTGSWSVLATAAVPRVYHSVALLLPDGRVWTAGSDYADVTESEPPIVDHEGRIELFSPPYLYLGPRPTISSAPTVATVASDLEIGTPQAADIATVALLRCGSVTHAFNPDQRYVRLEITGRTPAKLTVRSPPNLKIAPPGYYLLFILTSAGVPSVAKFMRLQ